MTVKIKFETINNNSGVSETNIFNVFAIEHVNDELRVKHVGQNYTYSLNNFDTRVIRDIEIIL